ncbi:hypothetical protein QBC45DRAFT_404494 [Copromyces sp. CBS 386.78]|nr:hypothetical protein QBC45DRAFT_404494 [Copromyces sp. CBS 386.78]
MEIGSTPFRCRSSYYSRLPSPSSPSFYHHYDPIFSAGHPPPLPNIANFSHQLKQRQRRQTFHLRDLPAITECLSLKKRKKDTLPLNHEPGFKGSLSSPKSLSGRRAHSIFRGSANATVNPKQAIESGKAAKCIQEDGGPWHGMPKVSPPSPPTDNHHHPAYNPSSVDAVVATVKLYQPSSWTARLQRWNLLPSDRACRL